MGFIRMQDLEMLAQIQKDLLVVNKQLTRLTSIVIDLCNDQSDILEAYAGLKSMENTKKD